jgi:hypothetical protein
MILFGRSCSFISTIFNDLVIHLTCTFQHRLFWDPNQLTLNKLQEYARHIDIQGGGDCIWGWIDGTVQRTCRPSVDQRELYSGHKKYHGFKFQAVTTPDGLVSSLFGPIVACRGDWFMFEESDLDAKVLPLFEGLNEAAHLYVYGDPAYTSSDISMGAYRRPRHGDLTEEQHEFNTAMSRRRIEVEHSFALMQNKWTRLAMHTTLRTLSSPISAYFTVAVLLTNIHTCIYGNQTSQKFECLPPSLETYFSN